MVGNPAIRPPLSPETAKMLESSKPFLGTIYAWRVPVFIDKFVYPTVGNSARFTPNPAKIPPDAHLPKARFSMASRGREARCA